MLSTKDVISKVARLQTRYAAKAKQVSKKKK